MPTGGWPCDSERLRRSRRSLAERDVRPVAPGNRQGGLMPSTMMAVVTVQIVFETHSTTEDNEAGIAAGWLPGRLSATGRQQAVELGSRRRCDGLTAVFSSDLTRAADTVEIALGGSGIPRFADWRLRECNYGSLNGSPAAEVHDDRLARLEVPYPGGESWAQATERVGWFVEDLGRFFGDARVLVVGHVATRWGLDRALRGITLGRLAGERFVWQPGWQYRMPGRTERAILENWLGAPSLAGPRLRLEALRVEHADEMAPLLDDLELHTFIGGKPASCAELRERYRRQVAGRSPDGCERWLNWVVRRASDRHAVGTLQATVTVDAGRPVAEVAWVIASAEQGRGYAREAATAMVAWLRTQGVAAVVAHIHPNHRASAAVAAAAGLCPTDFIEDGETRWVG